MADLYASEYGKSVIVNCEYDLSSATEIRILFSASATTFSATCSILAANYTTSAGEVFSAGKAVEYLVGNGDFSASPGTYRAWIQATFTGARLVSDSFEFIVANDGDP